MKLPFFPPAAPAAAAATFPSPTRLPAGPLLAIDWNETSVSLLHVLSTAGPMEFGARLHLPWPEELKLPLHAAQAGTWLKTELRRHGLPLLPAVVCAPRRRGLLKLLEIPPAAPELLADLVRSQAEHRSGAEVGSVRIDFLPLPLPPPPAHGSATAATTAVDENPLRPVLAVVLSNVIVQQIRSVLEGAGITPLAMGIGELALPCLADNDERLVLDILANTAKVELTLSRRGYPLASQSLSSENLERDAPTWLATAERIRQALPASMASAAIDEVRIWGPRGAEAAERLRTTATIGVSVIPTAHENDLRSIAYLTSMRSAPLLLDFLHPRQAADPAVVRRQRIRRGALWAAASLAPLGVWFGMEQADLDSRLARLREEVRDRRQYVERGQDLVAASTFVDDWEAARPDWGQELGTLLPLLPRGETGYLTRLQLEQREGESPSIQVSGLARSADEIAGLNTRLVRDHSRYELQPRAIEPNPLDPEYEVRFQTDLTVRPPAAAATEEPSPDRAAGGAP
ncbi:hypothetical protein [Planctomyces sp. SH-PL14]|uniref:hypothetical protein n=1 Tax=Planctomyces sp. SH-PL14 TaxID=1632864 RepID=UPI00078BA8A6|nr:hypothetical protein [Planctomyces sp. SH-PL14]AMV19835.1 hypothetical protein VT03_18195 [Planctomyces sp. SH-PL14]